MKCKNIHFDKTIIEINFINMYVQYLEFVSAGIACGLLYSSYTVSCWPFSFVRNHVFLPANEEIW